MSSSCLPILTSCLPNFSNFWFNVLKSSIIVGGLHSLLEATWPFPVERAFVRGIFGLDSVWEASWPFPTGRTLGLGILASVSAPRNTIVFVHPRYRQDQETLGRLPKNISLIQHRITKRHKGLKVELQRAPEGPRRRCLSSKTTVIIRRLKEGACAH